MSWVSHKSSHITGVARGTPDELRVQGGHEDLEEAFVALAGTAEGGARR